MSEPLNQAVNTPEAIKYFQQYKNQAAEKYLSNGLSVIPTIAGKKPFGEWKKFQSEKMRPDEVQNYFNTDRVEGIGIICGKVSGKLEVIDVDCKYDLTGRLFENLSDMIADHLPDVWEKFVIISTVGNGYHIYYRCEEIQGSQKLANRPTTEEERQQTNQLKKAELEAKAAKETTEETRAKATEQIEAKARKAAENDKVRVLIETRGDRSYVIAPPSPGYKNVGTFKTENIPTITKEERECVLAICRSFDEMPATPEPEYKAPQEKREFTGMGSFEDYNQRGDVPKLLEENEWTRVKQTGDRIHFKRPGGSKALTSGDFHTGLRLFKVFSTSTDFDAGIGYNPSQVYTILECNSDKSKASKQLSKAGFGDSHLQANNSPTQKRTAVKQPKNDTPVGATNEPHEISAELAGRIIDLSQDEPDIQFLFEKNGVGCIPQGDIVVLKGKGKHGKTTVIAIWITALLKGEFFGFKAVKPGCRVLYLDTEQNRANTWRLTKKVHILCGYPTNESQPNFIAINLRGDNPSERNQYMDEAIEFFKPDLLVIDGAKDLILSGDINDIKSCGETVQKMMTISAQHNLAIVTILHENKTDTNLRGHIGTELLNKCAENWQTVKNADGSFEVKQIECRNQPADDFGYTLDENVLPVQTDSAPRVSQKEITEMKKQATFRQCLPPMKRSSYTELTNLFCEYHGCKERTATDAIAAYLKKNFLIHETDGTYKYNYQKEVQ